MRNVYKFGIPLEKAVKAASYNPAKAIGVSDKCGSLEIGKMADIVVLEDNLDVNKVIIKGKIHK